MHIEFSKTRAEDTETNRGHQNPKTQGGVKVLADARGAKQVMAPALATAIGKRLSTHADRVRAVLDAATATAVSDRERVRNATE